MYRDASQPIEARVEDLLARMTLEERVAQLSGMLTGPLTGAQGPDPGRMQAILGNGLGHISLIFLAADSPRGVAETANAIQRFLVEKTRLGIPAMMHSEALNGVVGPGFPNFPTAIGLAATWEPELVTQMTELTRQQMRAAGINHALSPVLDVARDARWGRVHETYGEDPYLCAAMGVAFVKGLQGKELAQGVAATGKHFLGYGWSEAGQNMAATHAGPREIYEVFACPFEAAIREAGLATVMNSYSEIDGIPVGASKAILTDLLRDKLGFRGPVVSDYFTVSWLVERLGVARDPKEASVEALEAGLDAELPVGVGYGAPLIEAVRQGAIAEELVNRSVRRTLRLKFALGLFEQPYVDAAAADAPTRLPANRALSQQLAAKSMTLLKNEGSLLPLRKDLRAIAVIGPHADTLSNYFPGYTYPAIVGVLRNPLMAAMGILGDAEGMQWAKTVMPDVFAAKSVDDYVRSRYPAESILKAVERLASPQTRVLHAQGCDGMGDSSAGIPAAVEAARQADVVVLALGGVASWLFGGTESEARDTANLDLPGVQQQLLEAVVATGKPVVMVLFGGRPYTIRWAAEHVPAILAVYYPGQEGGGAIAGALFGDINPGGRVPITIPRHVGQVPIYYGQKRGSGYRRTASDLHKGYTDMPTTPLYPFGHGLSYTTFEYGDLRISPAQVDSRGAVEIACRVKNSGPVDGDEVVQLYIHDAEAQVTRPAMELAGFKRVHLAAGASGAVTFTVQMSQLCFLDREMRLVVEPGNVEVMIGASSDDIRLRGKFEISGDKVEVAGKRAFLSTATVAP